MHFNVRICVSWTCKRTLFPCISVQYSAQFMMVTFQCVARKKHFEDLPPCTIRYEATKYKKDLFIDVLEQLASTTTQKKSKKIETNWFNCETLWWFDGAHVVRCFVTWSEHKAFEESKAHACSAHTYTHQYTHAHEFAAVRLSLQQIWAFCF